MMKLEISTLVAAAALVAGADVLDRPSGIKIGERITLRPYVSLSYTYDSNVDSSKHSKSGSSWVVNPGLNLEYRGENWNVAGGVWYQYHAYNNYSSQLNSSSYGENLAFSWANSLPNERGWSLMVSENFAQIAQDDDMSNHGGRGIGRDRMTIQVNGALERRINEHLHGNINASYYKLDYDNDVDSYGWLFGWQRTTAGAELGYAASQWTDFIVDGSYMWYTSDNTKGSRYSRDSRGLSLMAGIATRATERIEYRLLTGWSRFEFADGLDTVNGWTYELSARWNMTEDWDMMALASSYYQPSEREAGSAIRVDSISWGVRHALVQGKLNATFDLNYRREDHEYSYDGAYDYTDDIITARLGLAYTLNRFLQVYGGAEYQTDMCDGGNTRGHNYDYDRFRGTVGMRLTY